MPGTIKGYKLHMCNLCYSVQITTYKYNHLFSDLSSVIFSGFLNESDMILKEKKNRVFTSYVF